MAVIESASHMLVVRSFFTQEAAQTPRNEKKATNLKHLGSFTLHFGLKYEIIYQLDAIEYLFVFFQLDMFRVYTPIFRSNGCYSFFRYAACGVLGVVRCRS